MLKEVTKYGATVMIQRTLKKICDYDMISLELTAYLYSSETGAAVGLISFSYCSLSL